jgi:hypothetical protein
MLYLEEEALKTPFCKFSLRAAAPSAVQEGQTADTTASAPNKPDAELPEGAVEETMDS